MGATKIPMTMKEERVARRLDHGCVEHERVKVVRDRRATTIAEVSGRDRLQSLAQFLECDAGAVAAGLIEAVERDPQLRITKL